MSQLIPALPGLIAIGLGTGLLALFGRDPKTNDANQHDVSDYKPTLHPARRNWPLVDQKATATTAPAVEPIDDDILPPAPPGMNAGSPLYAGMLFDTWHPETPAETAARFLREIRDEALAGAR